MLARLGVRAASALMQLKERTLERWFKKSYGASPAKMKCITRGNNAFLSSRAQFQAQQNVNYAAIAADHDYVDQAHLCKETRALTAHTPSELAQKVLSDDDSYWIYRLPVPDLSEKYKN